MLQQVEEKKAILDDKAAVTLRYRVNGKDLREWHWPGPR
jgi:hypothetical protein